MFSNLDLSENNDFVKAPQESINLESINSDIILNINNSSHIITVTYGTNITTFLSNITHNYNENICFKIISQKNYIKLYGELDNEDKLIVILDNKTLIEYTINVLAVIDAKNFCNLDFDNNNNFNLKILLDNSTSEFLIGENNPVTLNGNMILSGYLNENQVINLNNISIDGTLFLNIYLGHINLNNIESKNIVILSAGYRSVSFKGTSSAKNISVLTKKPVRIDAENGTNLENITLSPSGDSLNKNRILLNGNFSNTTITTTSSLTLEGGDTLRIDNPIHIQNNNPDDQIKLKGNFQDVKNVLVEKPITIIGDTQFPPENLNLEIKTNTLHSTVTLKDNLSSTNVFVSKNSSILCNGTINNFNVVGPEEVYLQLNPGTTINNFDTSSIVKVEGNQASVDELLEHSSIHDRGDIIIDVVFETISFINGRGTITTSIPEPGDYDISLKVQEADKIVTLDEKIHVIIREE